MTIGSPVRGLIHPTGWKRPAGNYEPRLVRGFYGQEPNHDGVDISFGRVGDPIRAADAGRVVFASQPAGDSLYVVLDHGDLRTLYGHLDDETVTVGEYVGKGDIIGHCGHTGYTVPSGPAGAHLHFEVFRESNNQRLDPWPLIQPRVRPAGNGIRIRSKPTTDGNPYAATRSGDIVRDDGANLGFVSTWRKWGGRVTGAEWNIDGRKGTTWEKVWIGSAYRYIASPLIAKES